MVDDGISQRRKDMAESSHFRKPSTNATDISNTRIGAAFDSRAACVLPEMNCRQGVIHQSKEPQTHGCAYVCC